MLPTGFCSICNNQEVKEINEKLFVTTQQEVIETFGLNKNTLLNHIKNCLKLTQTQIVKQTKIQNFNDANEHYQRLVNKGDKAISAAEAVLTVNGQLNYHPRAWEIQVVYKDYDDLDENGFPREKVDYLDNLLETLANKGKKVKKVTTKTEDPRKTYREERRQQKELIETYFKIFGVFREHDDRELSDQLQHIKAGIEYAAKKQNQSYLSALTHFLEVYKEKIRAEIRAELETEATQLRLKGI
jgi:hypothetical protein